MAVSLQENALVTLAAAKTYLTAGDDKDDVIKDIINRISAWAEGPSGANRPLVAQTFTAVRVAGQRGPNLRVKATPIDVMSPISITLDGTALTVWKRETDGEPADKDVIVCADDVGTPSYFYRGCGWRGATPEPILLTYTGGFDPVPEHLRDAALECIQSVWRVQVERIVSDIAAYGPGPVTPGVTFRPIESLLPRRAADSIRAYRVAAL